MSGPDPEEQPPAWMSAMIQSQTASLSSILERHLASQLPADKPPKKKKSKKSKNKPPSSPRSHPQDSDDDFDRRFGHLIGNGVDDDDGHRLEDDDLVIGSQGVVTDKKRPREDPSSDEDSDGSGSVDEDLVRIQKSVPNWPLSHSIQRFFHDSADDPLPEEYLKDLNNEYVPQEKLQKFFAPPHMPTRLYKRIARMPSKGAFRTEKAMYAAQTELFIIAKPMVASFVKLRGLRGDGVQEAVKEARSMICIGMHGIFSVSLKISKARRENVKFLFKESLAEALYAFPPSHLCLFGGVDFYTQMEKACKEAKIELLWPKQRPSNPNQSFRNQGFRNNAGAGYFGRQFQRGRRGGYRGRGYYGGTSRFYNYNNNNNNYRKSGYQKSKRGSGGGKSQ